jgi:hypothetical protein
MEVKKRAAAPRRIGIRKQNMQDIERPWFPAAMIGYKHERYSSWNPMISTTTSTTVMA